MTDNEIIFRHISYNNKINKMICKDNKIFILSSVEWSLKEYTKNPKGAIVGILMFGVYGFWKEATTLNPFRWD